MYKNAWCLVLMREDFREDRWSLFGIVYTDLLEDDKRGKVTQTSCEVVLESFEVINGNSCLNQNPLTIIFYKPFEAEYHLSSILECAMNGKSTKYFSHLFTCVGSRFNRWFLCYWSRYYKTCWIIIRLKIFKCKYSSWDVFTSINYFGSRERYTSLKILQIICSASLLWLYWFNFYWGPTKKTKDWHHKNKRMILIVSLIPSLDAKQLSFDA